jgi:DNA-directed RNA polymerase
MIPVTHEQLEEQIALEREAIAQGLKKLRDNTMRLEQKDYASASIYGVASIDTLLPLVVERIQETVDYRLKRGCVGVAFKEIQQYLSHIEPLAAAAIACKLTFDKVFSYKDGSNRITKVCESIAHAVEDECQMRFYEREAPGLLRTIKDKYWHDSCGTHQRMVLTRTLMNRYDVPEWDSWGAANRVKLGAWLLDCIMQASGWFTKLTMQEGRKRVTYVVPTAAFMDIKDQVMANAELFSPIAWPMLVPPNDWSNGKSGGYMLNDVMRGHDMVRRGRPSIQGEIPIAFLNQIQKVPFCINPFIYGVAVELQGRGVKLGKFIPIVEHPLPAKPADIDTNYDSRKDYRRRAAETHNINAHSFKASCRTRMTMQVAERFKNRDRFYLPWSFDYRGRAYPIPAFLTPQDTDFGKSLIRFADGSYVTPEAESWLAFQVATTYGLDKSPLPERLEWVRNNLTLITQVATDPLGSLSEWEAAEEPWQFLAACEEYYACIIDCRRNFTSLMVATDATCSGLQILAGLARDASTARLVNVLPSESPQDAYKVVAEAARPDCPEVLKEHLDRKVTKRVVMTVPYNAKPFSNRGYIRDALKDKGVVIEKDDLTTLVKAIRDAMDKIVPGPMKVMKWIESEVAKAIKAGSTELTWTTPSGFVVTQKLMKPEVETLKLQLLGKIQKVSVKVSDSDVVDLGHHKNATAPNLIHSLDASLLHIAATRFNAPIALIHDSVLCRATDMSVLSTIVRETYMHLFAEHDYLTDWANQIGATEPPPIIGDLEPETVIESTYFFC